MNFLKSREKTKRGRYLYSLVTLKVTFLITSGCSAREGAAGAVPEDDAALAGVKWSVYHRRMWYSRRGKYARRVCENFRKCRTTCPSLKSAIFRSAVLILEVGRGAGAPEDHSPRARRSADRARRAGAARERGHGSRLQSAAEGAGDPLSLYSRSFCGLSKKVSVRLQCVPSRTLLELPETARILPKPIRRNP